MIYLHTGQPGAGKTLYTLWYVKRMAEQEGRTVYYSGITDLVIPGWVELAKAEEWHQLPAGAIVVIDECQRVFRPRTTGAGVPPHVSAFETHRHHGHDVFLITQHPMLLDGNIRRLVGTHRHIMRAFGAGAARVHEWREVRDNPDKKRSGSDSVIWKYPKEVFSYYKSAELHTHKMRLPRAFWAVAVGLIVFAALGYGAYRVMRNLNTKPDPIPTTAPTLGGPSGVQPSGQGKGPDISTPAQYAAAYAPRIEGLPHTAPAFDQVTQPVEAPIPVACVKSQKNGCRCWTQQGTRYQTTPQICDQMVAGSMPFIPWKQAAAPPGGPLQSRPPGEAREYRPPIGLPPGVGPPG